MAGIIGAKNNTIGVLGVASGASLVALKVLDKDGEGNLSYIIQAIAYINTIADAGDVVNMSVGGESGSDILDQQVRNTAARGIYFSIAAGNENKLANLSSPARANASNVYTVSAVDSLDNFASFSNYGNDVVDYAAPGVRILSTWTDNRMHMQAVLQWRRHMLQACCCYVEETLQVLVLRKMILTERLIRLHIIKKI